MRRVIFPIAAIVGFGLVGCTNPFDAGDLQDGEPDHQADAEVPAFGEIREEMFSSMLAADSVAITGEVVAGEADLDELFEGLDGDTSGELAISGALDGTDSEMSFSAGDSSFTQRAVESQEYFHGEDFAALLVSELDDEVSELVDQEFIEETIGDSWVVFDDAEGSVFSAEEFITTWESELSGEEVDAMTAQVEERDGQQVWVYTADAGESEYVVAAEGDPYLLAISDEASQYTFAEWNDSAPPEVPDSVITLDEVFDAIAEDQGWDPEDLESDDADSEDEAPEA